MTTRRTSRAARLGSLDRRWLYLILVLAVGAAVLLRPVFPDSASVFVEPVFDQIEALPPGTVVLVSLDYSPVAAPELVPMVQAVTRHLLWRGAHPVFLTLYPEGAAMFQDLRTAVLELEFPDREPGRDWTNLGYKAGGHMVINALRQQIGTMFTADADGRPLVSVEKLADIDRLGDVGLIVSFSSGWPGLKEWILYGGDPTGVPVVGGCTGIGTPEYLAYFPTQLKGLLGGLKGASEYESALAARYPDRTFPRLAGRVMGPQTVAHVVILFFLILGNLAYLRRGRGREDGP